MDAVDMMREIVVSRVLHTADVLDQVLRVANEI